jgi:hypothetical protein
MWTVTLQASQNAEDARRHVSQYRDCGYVNGMNQGVPSDERINAMTESEYLAYELRVRQLAHSRGLELRKARRHDPRTANRERYTLIQVEETATGKWRSKTLITSRRGLALQEIHRLLVARSTW